MNDEEVLVRCATCNVEVRGMKRFNAHHRNIIHNLPLQCGYCDLLFEHRTSLVRHLKLMHFDVHAVGVQEPGQAANINLEGDRPVDEQPIVGAQVLQNQPDVGENVVEVAQAAEEEVFQEIDLPRAAAVCTLNLRQTGGITSSVIGRFQVECNKMLQSVSANHGNKVKQFLDQAGINTPASQELLRQLKFKDPFQHIKTLRQQLSYFSKEFGMVKPETKFLDYRNDFFLNSATAQYEPTQVPMSFESISIVETLTAVVSNPKIRTLIAAERPSEDGVLRSYLDGSKGQSHPLVTRYPHIIRLQLYWDDVEVVNPLGSKTSIHKLAAFYVSIQNLPLVESSQLSSIYLLTLAHSEDLKVHGAFEKVLTPLLLDIAKLERGLNITVDGEPFVLRATVTNLIADTLAAHDILGLLGPGARCFCRMCMITRAEFHQNCNAMGLRRTKELFTEHVNQVSRIPAFSTECGVRKDCPLHRLQYFDATEDSVFDIFHDLLEGVGQWDMSLALRSFIKTNKLFSVEDFNSRVAAFNYGIPDSKNKPSANFTDDSFKGSKKKLKQTGSQVWCLIRAFGFLVPEVPEDNVHLRLVNTLQKIMLIVFSEEVRPADIDEVDGLTFDHNAQFQQIHMDVGEEILPEESSESEDSDPDEPVVVVQNRRRKTNPGNKMHHMKHYAEQMRKFGPLIRFWCARCEARHHIFCKYGAVCCNFINIPKSMAQMFQMSTLSGIQSESQRQEELEVLGANQIYVEDCDDSQLLIDIGLDRRALVEIASAVKIAGHEYVLLEVGILPCFAIIQRVYVFEDQIPFILQRWETVNFVDRYCAYEVKPLPVCEREARHLPQLPRHGCYAPWNPWKSRVTFLAPRTVIF